MFFPNLTVLGLITSVLAKLSQDSYLREFGALKSQIVSLADLTVLRLITKKCHKTHISASSVH